MANWDWSRQKPAKVPPAASDSSEATPQEHGPTHRCDNRDGNHWNILYGRRIGLITWMGNACAPLTVPVSPQGCGASGLAALVEFGALEQRVLRRGSGHDVQPLQLSTDPGNVTGRLVKHLQTLLNCTPVR